MFDIHNNVGNLVAFKIQTVASDTTTNGEIIDLQNYESCEFLFQTGTVTDGDYLPLIEHGDDSGLSDAAAVPDSGLLGTEADAGFTADTDDDAVSKIGYVAGKRYVRFSVVSTNTTTGALLGAQVVLSNARHNPVA